MPPAPRAGITVTVDTGASAVTDAMGQFTVTGLPAGARTFRVTLMDFDDPTRIRCWPRWKTGLAGRSAGAST